MCGLELVYLRECVGAWRVGLLMHILWVYVCVRARACALNRQVCLGVSGSCVGTCVEVGVCTCVSSCVIHTWLCLSKRPLIVSLLLHLLYAFSLFYKELSTIRVERPSLSGLFSKTSLELKGLMENRNSLWDCSTIWIFKGIYSMLDCVRPCVKQWVSWKLIQT